MMDEKRQTDIDFVLTWVDGTDPAWQAQKAAYCSGDSQNAPAVRYRDWGLLRYWFRGVEACAPWVRKIHFVTCGQHPAWLRRDHPKLHCVDHREFIPAERLPLFNSAAIEMHLHRIPELAEQFVYFNDDMFLLRRVAPTFFFRDGLPRDAAILNPVQMVEPVAGLRAEINDLYLINRDFKPRQVLRKYRSNFFTPLYGKELIRTLLLSPYKFFPGFVIHHLPLSLTRSVMEEVWGRYPEALARTAGHRFRDHDDVNPWLFQYYQYVTGRFVPRSPSVGKMFEGPEFLPEMCRIVRNRAMDMICCNDSGDFSDFDRAGAELRAAFDSILPSKSSFEI